MSKSKKKRNNIKYSKRDFKDRTEFLNIILRYWFHMLTATERLAVLFIYDRTWGWNKEWETITVNQFTQGVFSYREEEGKMISWAAPFTKDRTLAQKTIKGLVEKKVVLRKGIQTRRGKQFEYSLNKEWECPTIKAPEKIGNRIRKQLEQSEED